MASRSRRRRKTNGDAMVTVAVGVLIALVMMGAAWLYIRADRNNPVLAEKTLCPAGPKRAVVAMVIDTTDPISAITRADIQSRLHNELEQVPRFAEVQLFGAGPDESRLLRPVFARCNPGRGADVGTIDSSPELVERTYQRDFLKPFEAALESLLQPAKADRSPILEGIQAVAVAAFPPAMEQEPKRLIVVSDFLQNSERFSMYRRLDPDQGAAAAKALEPNLNGVEVRLLVIGRDRDQAIQSQPAFEQYWSQWFGTGGAILKGSLPLAGRN